MFITNRATKTTYYKKKNITLKDKMILYNIKHLR